MLRTKAGLRSGTLALLFGVLIVATFFIWIEEGSITYGVITEGENIETFAAINKTLDDINAQGSYLEDKARSIKENPIGTIFFIPAAMIDALLSPIDFMTNVMSIITAFNKSIGIPEYITYSIITAFLIYLVYLIIDAYLRFNNT
jgi:hypothetical protein